MRERKRKHDDAHYPLGGKGKRATKPKNPKYTGPTCECGYYPKGSTHLCSAPLAPDATRGEE